jgi:N-methylhydantoinase A/oxoprolinase/acetone carboxylase beta subunit
VVTFDIGGTSTDISVVTDARAPAVRDRAQGNRS